MRNESLVAFITDYISGRRQAKLDAFEKEAAKRLASDENLAVEVAQERRELELRYTPQNWLTDAAARAGQISLVTHAAKFTHGDSKSGSIYSEVAVTEGYLGSAALNDLSADAVGNAASLDVAKLLQSEVEGDSLLASLKRKDYRALKAFAENDQQLTQWIDGFSQALNPPAPASHKLAKQIYFPVEGGYHLLSPLFASSLAHAMHQKMAALRFGDEAKAARQARKNGTWHEKTLVQFRNVAEIHFGGTKPQNVSALNSARRGAMWLLSTQPPVWRRSAKPPIGINSVFRTGGEFNAMANHPLQLLVSLLSSTATYNNVHIRDARDRYIDEIVDTLFFFASKYQTPEWQGWTLQCPELPLHQQLWLDPWRTKNDDAFRLQREQDDWQELIAEDFARWLNYRLGKTLKDLGQPEQREWETRPRFCQQLREMEQIISEGLR